MKSEMISIILPTFNRAFILGKAVESILKQTYPHFELIIVDDGSTDNTEELVADLIGGGGDKRISYYKLKENKGQSYARNYGIEQAQYDYIAFNDSDDIWYPDKLEIQMRMMSEAPHAGFCYHKILYEIDDKTVIVPSDKIAIEKKTGDIYEQLFHGNLVPCPSLLIRRECIMAFKFDVFDTNFKALEDYDLVLRMAKSFRALFIDEVLLKASDSWIFHDNNSVSNNAINYLVALCRLLQKYKTDYIKTNTLNETVEHILKGADKIDFLRESIIKLLELSLK